MKFLFVPQLSAVTNCLSQREIGDVTYDGRVESYSLKEAGSDRRLARELEETLRQEEGLHRQRSSSFSHVFADLQASPSSSPDPRHIQPERQQRDTAPVSKSGSAAGVATEVVDSRTLYFLIAALNASYPDYDFGLLRASHFVRLDQAALRSEVYGHVNANLAELDREESIRPTLPSELEAITHETTGDQEVPVGSTAAGNSASAVHKASDEVAPKVKAGSSEGQRKRKRARSGSLSGGIEELYAGSAQEHATLSVASHDVATSQKALVRKRARLDSKGSPLAANYGSHFLSAVWRIIDEAITLPECEVYSYCPDMDADPLSVGCLWSYNFFFLNRKLNRMVYFAATAQPKRHALYGAPAVPLASKFLRRKVASDVAGQPASSAFGLDSGPGVESNEAVDGDAGVYAGARRPHEVDDAGGSDDELESAEDEGYGSDEDEPELAPSSSARKAQAISIADPTSPFVRQIAHAGRTGNLPALLASVASPVAVLPRRLSVSAQQEIT